METLKVAARRNVELQTKEIDQSLEVYYENLAREYIKLESGKKKLETLVNSLELEKSQMADYDEQLAKLKNKERLLAKTIKKSKLEIEKASQIIRNKDSQIAKLNFDLNEIHNALEYTKNESEDRRALLDQQDRQNSLLESELDYKTKLIEGLTKEIEEHSQNKQHYIEEYSQNKQHYEDVEAARKQLQEKNAALSNDVQYLHEAVKRLVEEAEELRTANYNVKNNLEVAQDKYEQLESTNSELFALLVTEKSEKQQILDQYNNIDRGVDTSVYVHLLSDYQSALDGVKTLKEQLGRAVLESKQLKLVIDQRTGDFQSELWQRLYSEARVAELERLNRKTAEDFQKIYQQNSIISERHLNFKKEMDRLKNEMAVKNELIRSTVLKSSNLSDELKSSLALIKTLNDQVIFEQKKADVVTLKVTDLEAKIKSQSDQLTAQLNEFQKARAVLISEMEMKDQVLLESQNKRSELVGENRMLNQSLVEAEKAKKVAIKTMESFREQYGLLKSKMDDLQKENRDENNELKGRFESALLAEKSEKLKWQHQADSFHFENTQLKMEISELNAQLNLARDKATEAFNKFHTHQREKQKKVGTEFEEFEVVRSELAITKEKLTALALEKDQIESELKKSQKRHSEREVQISRYTQFVNEEKNKYRSVVAQLQDEIQTATKMNPLLDLLNITERELSRVEGELKKTPLVATNRGTLERAVDQLIIQRDQIKVLIEESQKSLKKHTNALNRLANDAISTKVPDLFASAESSGV